MIGEKNTDDVRIKEVHVVLPPVAIREKYPLTEKAADTVINARKEIQNIMDDRDDRLVVVTGPCSIHDPKSAIEYANRLAVLREKYKDTLHIIMRVYFEKPRTTVGWKGLINDPYLDHSYKINDGLRIGRKLMLDVNNLGVPAAVEFLDILSPQYFDELISWGAIGARTTESQLHREMASGLSCPVGFKNNTDGSVKIATDAIQAARSEHSFLSVTKFGHSAIFRTTGNNYCHLILRGGKNSTNYDSESVASACEALSKAGLPQKVMIDFSHANSSKQFKKQVEVCENVSAQIAAGNNAIFGVMIESHLVEGRQDCKDPKDLVYGQSITDACVGWDDTELIISKLSAAVEARRQLKK
ncbi:MAG: 3-deoxy-7-phosphoheptulonate synthase AroG [Succinivibrionaceae bacterium]|nr:3-deoxy-7-phosphoheptulonate synthase AroG [Succinivibrionaceae bacterium]